MGPSRKHRLAIIIPSYGHFDYVVSAVHSAFANTHCAEPFVIVVDDASPDWYERDGVLNRDLREALDQRPVRGDYMLMRFEANGGLTRSWNAGLEAARDAGAEYACCTNSDVIFSPAWDEPLIYHLQRGYSLVGPITNAPGAERNQAVEYWLPTYTVSDDPISIEAVARDLRERYRDPLCVVGPLNGFCLMAKTGTWWAHAHHAGHVFRPRNNVDFRGNPNPTPLMTLGEFYLQQRWRAADLKIGFCPQSFVFHYRSVSRGPTYIRGLWWRKPS